MFGHWRIIATVYKHTKREHATPWEASTSNKYIFILLIIHLVTAVVVLSYKEVQARRCYSYGSALAPSTMRNIL
jgi:hypothetical protein